MIMLRYTMFKKKKKEKKKVNKMLMKFKMWETRFSALI